MSRVKVLVGVITAQPYQYCLDEFCARVKDIVSVPSEVVFCDNSSESTYREEIKRKGFRVLKSRCLPDVRQRLAESRNVLREYLLKKGFEYFLSLEQDVIPPRDIVPRLLQHQKDIVSGVYFKILDALITIRGKPLRKSKALIPVLFDFAPPSMPGKMKYMSFQDVQQAQLKKVRACGLGCVLIRREVLEKIEFRVVPGNSSYDDLWFCDDAINAGFEIYADTGMKCKHLILKKDKNLLSG